MKTVKAYGIEWEILDPEYKAKDGTGILCIAKESVKKMAFSNDNNNYYDTSDAREYLSDLTTELESAGAEFLTVELDLTADDGTKWRAELYQGKDILAVKGLFLLTAHMYRDYRFNNKTGEKLISEKNTHWWAATTYSFSSGNTGYVMCICKDGTFSHDCARYWHIGVVPACVFYSLPDENQEEITKKQEKLDELKKQVEKLREELDMMDSLRTSSMAYSLE